MRVVSVREAGDRLFPALGSGALLRLEGQGPLGESPEDLPFLPRRKASSRPSWRVEVPGHLGPRTPAAPPWAEGRGGDGGGLGGGDLGPEPEEAEGVLNTPWPESALGGSGPTGRRSPQGRAGNPALYFGFLRFQVPKNFTGTFYRGPMQAWACMGWYPSPSRPTP